jgi:PPK2 family polyphosphate:nucleotide phosphotransferase
MRAPSVDPGSTVRLRRIDPADTDGYEKDDRTEQQLASDLVKLADLQERFYAENRRSLLIVLQSMDTGGKDGTIKHVFSGINPIGCQVTCFKQPSEEELDHDFLWRIGKALPRRGNIGIFNRSHYEDVLVVRVHGLVPRAEWKARYEQINRFEKQLVETGTTILKFFLHISKAEQKRRLEARLRDQARSWKFDPGDLAERALWSDYQAAYEDALSRCSTPWAPWTIVPADHKWYRNLVVARTIVKTLQRMDPQPPPPKAGLRRIKIR